MAFNTEFILVSAIIADNKSIGSDLPSDKIQTICNMNNLSYDAVNEIMEEVNRDKENATKFASRLASAISVAKATDADDDDLKNCTEAYAVYMALAQKIIERYGERADEMLLTFQQQIDKLRNPEL